MKSPYSPAYYAKLTEGSRASAAVVAPLVRQLVNPQSVIDVGCGTGAWLAEFKRHGVDDVCGVDGPHIDREQLEVERREFLAIDLTQPLNVGRHFDLVISLEVAEHLPETLSNQFVKSLTELAPVVLFSAAVPDQGGEHHINEQWPAYWIDRFSAHGYEALDPFRRFLWQQPNVEWWYAQNILLFVRYDQLSKYSARATNLEWIQNAGGILPLIHPGNYQQHTWRNRVMKLTVDLATFVPAGEWLILVDEDRFSTLYLPGRVVVPFLERNGAYAGPPCDDEEAIAELRRMQKIGAKFIAFGWPSFWWLTHYRKLADHLEKHHSRIMQNDRLVLYSLRSNVQILNESVVACG